MGQKNVRYAVVGTGWFAQEAILPAFRNATEYSKLAAIVSGDPVKRNEVGERYGVPAYGYEQYDDLLESGSVDAVYIALPNAMHKEYTLRAAKHKIHVLTEKPMAATAAECREMVTTCNDAGVKLMVAYRLHFESGNLTAIDHIKNGKIGEPRLFSSVFTQEIQEGNTRLDAGLAGSPLMDIGIYCINAARYLFQDDPLEVTAFAASSGEAKFREVPEMVTAVLRFPKARLASFTCGFGEARVSEYRVVGTTGDLRMQTGYTFRGAIQMHLTDEKGETRTTEFGERDQVGPEIEYFSECVLRNREPEPNGLEGLADLIIIDAINEACATGRSVQLPPFTQKPRPSLAQEYKMPKVSAPGLVNAASPGG
ncbi:Gfo/Idh/MocA family oxidoreductase [Gemmata sp. JC673]|uniref:Gfo/Idh/MocA family oxidoreductase n=1 Tax=Gemmata algarum TaxID=2975278 RepID=A0ABU5ESN5_9BACT|nr:Gfo/Idh/MocA family oxidoreductase [Gemmata algarum]MDY3557974.1 Gfo/Idh/MocA family oxidoreductase [Gemmata algarum]